MLEKIEILGNGGQVPTGMSGAGPDATFVYNPDTDTVTVTGAAVSMAEPFTVTFTYWEFIY